ncbi:ephrin type-B receptor 1-B-like isoform X2 [Acropora muricata]|uniref:ephrin type-B receptor 1-B-like isoform X2 n=1 Tax=Acropora muricata TaxID=159855 RepID=UPI0034E57CB3
MEHLWITGLIALVFSSWASSKQHYIMETPDCRKCTWDWDTSASLPINGTTEGLSSKTRPWHHPQGLETNNRYTICYLDNKEEPNNWLRSYVIKVGDIGRLDVTFRYFIKACQPSVSFCKEYFYAYVWESNTSVKPQQIPDPIKNFQLYRRFANVTRQSGETNLTVPLQVTSKYIVMGIRDQGGCRTLYSVKISYKVCIEKTLENSLVSLPLTISEEESTPVQGICSANSVQIMPGNLTVICDSDGEWNTSRLESRCVCQEDMENRGGVCLACPSGTFNEGKGFNCTETPSEPRSASVYFVNESSAVLTWLLPEITGTPIDMSYDVTCQTSCEYFGSVCDDQTCNRGIDGQFTAEGLSTTIFTATSLAPFVNYTCKITAKNRVSKRADSKTEATDGERNSFTYVNVTTKGSVPGAPEDITVVYLTETNSIILSWIVKCKNGIIQEYRIEYFSVDDSSGNKHLSTRDNKIQIGSLLAGKTLRFQVYAVNNFGIGSPGVMTFYIPKGKLSLAFIAAASGGGAFVLIIIAVICLACVVRRRRFRHTAQSILEDYMRPPEQGFDSNLPLDQRRYINPENYLDLKELLQKFTTEVDRSNTKLNGLIGQGEFADVYKGSIQIPKGNLIVAVKVLRPGSNEKNQKDFLSEASIMGQFNHPNVIRLVGVVTQSCPMMILTEFLESGSLDHFLKTRKGKLKTIHLLEMARGVACGMVYLSEMNFIHRDLAARNILVGENLSCKVSDFGLSRELADDNPDSEYVTQGGKIAVRWTAPEALQSRKFSSASDVWSYGVLVWEIMSFSDRPYWEWNNYNVMNRVENGYRLPSPINCPKLVHNLMLNCWESDKTKRPTFADIVGSIDNFIRCPKDLNDDLSPVAEKFEAKPQQEFQSVDEWLHYINMDKYSDVFHAANINSLDKVTGLGDKELREMGIKLIGHRNKMTKSIQAMKENSVQ